jgi:tetratricopeptide (TPR) repeat protein
MNRKVIVYAVMAGVVVVGGIIFFRKFQAESATSKATKGDIIQETGDKIRDFYQGIVGWKTEPESEATKYQIEAKEYYSEAIQHYEEAIAYAREAVAGYEALGEYEKAEEYKQKIQEYLEKIKELEAKIS